MHAKRPQAVSRDMDPARKRLKPSSAATELISTLVVDHCASKIQPHLPVELPAGTDLARGLAKGMGHLALADLAAGPPPNLLSSALTFGANEWAATTPDMAVVMADHEDVHELHEALQKAYEQESVSEVPPRLLVHIDSLGEPRASTPSPINLDDFLSEAQDPIVFA